MTTQTQTQEERDVVIAEWDRTKGNLAETAKNLDLMQRTLVKYHEKNGNFISVSILRAVVASLHDQLDWLATTATPKLRGNFADRLYQVGIRPSEHTSHLTLAENELKKKDVFDQICDAAAILRQRQDLRRRLSEAQSATVTIASGPYAGRIDHSKSADARQAAIAKLAPSITAFNAAHPEQAIATN